MQPSLPHNPLAEGKALEDKITLLREMAELAGYTLVRADVPVLDWPDPASLGDNLPPVLTFDLDFLPLSLRPLVEDISERMQTPLDYAGAAAIVALAGCVNRRVVITPKCRDKSWRVVPNLWGAIVAPPGMMKSPILRAVTVPLTRIEEGWREEFASECSNFELEKEETELRYQAWREDYKHAVKKGHCELPIQPDRTLREPTQRRLVLTDSTFEKLHEILAENPAGVLVVRDELTGWLSDLDRVGREGERGFFLQAWNGDAGFTIDRIGRGSIYVPAVCVSLLGNIQPSRLRWYLSQVLEGGPSDDGLFQRFQVLVWPDSPREWRLVDRPVNDTAIQVTEKVFAQLVKLSADQPLEAIFAPDAQELFLAWWAELENKVRGDGLAPALAAHLAKYRSLMPSLAGLFEVADAASNQVELGTELSISLEHAKQAAALCEYLETHARRVYSCVTAPETGAARDLAGHVRNRDLPEKFKTRDVYLKGWRGLDTPERARSALFFLEDAGWLRRAEGPTSPGGGRPSELWAVNPKAVRHA